MPLTAITDLYVTQNLEYPNGGEVKHDYVLEYIMVFANAFEYSEDAVVQLEAMEGSNFDGYIPVSLDRLKLMLFVAFGERFTIDDLDISALMDLKAAVFNEEESVLYVGVTNPTYVNVEFIGDLDQPLDTTTTYPFAFSLNEGENPLEATLQAGYALQLDVEADMVFSYLNTVFFGGDASAGRDAE